MTAARGARLVACLLAVAVAVALLLAPQGAVAQRDTEAPTVWAVDVYPRFNSMDIYFTEILVANSFDNSSAAAFTVTVDGVLVTITSVSGVGTVEGNRSRMSIYFDTLPGGSTVVIYNRSANPLTAADPAGNELASFGWHLPDNIFVGGSSLTSSDDESAELVYLKLQDYYDHVIGDDELVASIQNLSSISSLLADFHSERRPIPLALVVGSPSVVGNYAQVGQRVYDSPCGSPRPGLSSDQVFAHQDYYCNLRTREWTLFQRPVMPPVSQWVGPYEITDTTCFYTHPTYSNTLSLTRGTTVYMGCPVAPPKTP